MLHTSLGGIPKIIGSLPTFTLDPPPFSHQLKWVHLFLYHLPSFCSFLATDELILLS